MKQPQPAPMPGMTPLIQGAIAAYELFQAYVAAGFTRAEALQLIAETMRGGEK